MNSLSKMNDQAIRSLYSAIIDDKEERDDYLLIRTTMWLVSEFQSAKISIDHPVPNIGDFRIVCLNEDDEHPIQLAMNDDSPDTFVQSDCD